MRQLLLHITLFSAIEIVSVLFNGIAFRISSSHSNTNLSISFFLHLKFGSSKYSPTLHDLSQSHSQILGFQINQSSHLPLLIISLHSHLHLSLFQRFVSLQTLTSNLQTHKFHAKTHNTFH